jgi:hypothetical protein
MNRRVLASLVLIMVLHARLEAQIALFEFRIELDACG